MALRAALLILATLAATATTAATAARPARETRPRCSDCHAGNHYAAYGTCVSCHRGNPRTRRVTIAHDHLLRGPAAAWSIPGSRALREGGRLRDDLGCRRCHVSGGKGNALAIALDVVVWRRTQEELRASLTRPATFMPDFGLSTGQADALIAVLLRDGDRNGRQERYLVRFRDGPKRAGAFATACGPCHRALTASGPQGVGSAGPNLSGLLSPYYPRTDGRAWDRARLERWVANPRTERPGTTMAPVELHPGELDEIVRTLAGDTTSWSGPAGGKTRGARN